MAKNSNEIGSSNWNQIINVKIAYNFDKPIYLPQIENKKFAYNSPIVYTEKKFNINYHAVHDILTENSWKKYCFWNFIFHSVIMQHGNFY